MTFFFTPRIPDKKLKNAIKSYGKNLDPLNVRVLVDFTLLGSAREGLIISAHNFFYKALADDSFNFGFDELKRVEQTDSVEKELKCYLANRDPVLIKDGDFINHNQLAAFFNAILALEK